MREYRGCTLACFYLKQRCLLKPLQYTKVSVYGMYYSQIDVKRVLCVFNQGHENSKIERMGERAVIKDIAHSLNIAVRAWR